MNDYYLQIKAFHIMVALMSGGLFALRGSFALAGAQWPNAAPVRWTSYAIDTALLTAALMLLTILPGAMFANGWLAVKLSLLVGYVVLGVYALRRAKTKRARVLSFLGALLLFASIYATARSHEPLGFVRWWFAQ
ncbi:SirB2 family protein [Lysobacter sp. A6]|uniref:SirB2 family protein n=1 Tax=Noviluteimonas lactosilytica TaxID=2888523 RepID=A0ABS8JGT0_9GAMM|nr:SirB2 family protein [Lysobacter lactosilyticus]MCC8362698.1 SirB2 family protein [Lysobacter lactosilyticus]